MWQLALLDCSYWGLYLLSCFVVEYGEMTITKLKVYIKTRNLQHKEKFINFLYSIFFSTSNFNLRFINDFFDNFCLVRPFYVFNRDLSLIFTRILNLLKPFLGIISRKHTRSTKQSSAIYLNINKKLGISQWKSQMENSSKYS